MVWNRQGILEGGVIFTPRTEPAVRRNVRTSTLPNEPHLVPEITLKSARPGLQSYRRGGKVRDDRPRTPAPSLRGRDNNSACALLFSRKISRNPGRMSHGAPPGKCKQHVTPPRVRRVPVFCPRTLFDFRFVGC